MNTRKTTVYLPLTPRQAEIFAAWQANREKPLKTLAAELHMSSANLRQTVHQVRTKLAHQRRGGETMINNGDDA